MWGWLENTYCQSGERAHKDFLKCLQKIHNNREVFPQFLWYWERAEQLWREKNKNDFEAELEVDDNEVSEEDKCEESMHSCELGVRCPLFFMAANRHEQHFRAADWVGAGPEPRYRFKHTHCGRQAFNVWTMIPGSMQMHKVKYPLHAYVIYALMLIWLCAGSARACHFAKATEGFRTICLHVPQQITESWQAQRQE